MFTIIQFYIATKILMAFAVFILSIIESTSKTSISTNVFVGRALLNLLYIADIVFIKLKLSSTKLSSALIHLVTRNFFLICIIGHMARRELVVPISICWFLLDISHYIYSLFKCKWLRICRYYIVLLVYPVSVSLECLSIYRSFSAAESLFTKIVLSFCFGMYLYASVYLFFRVLRQKHWYNSREISDKLK